MEQNKISLKIAGKQYAIKGDATIDRLFTVGLYVDRAISELQAYDKSLSTEEAAILAALNITDEYLKLKEKTGEQWQSGDDTLFSKLPPRDKTSFNKRQSMNRT